MVNSIWLALTIGKLEWSFLLIHNENKDIWNETLFYIVHKFSSIPKNYLALLHLTFT
jgi:hypothetical protein